MELDGEKRRDLRKTLIEAYPERSDLAIMVSDQLDVNLNVIVGATDLEDTVFKLIQWAGARGRMSELVLGARQSNPGNEKLFVFAQKLGLTSTNEKRSTLEKVVGGNKTFLNVAVWREVLTKLEWRVCRVDYKKQGQGTGFLVGPSAVLTNYHVVQKAIGDGATWDPSDISCRFDYKANAGGVITSGAGYGLAEDWLIDYLPYSPHDLKPDPKPGVPTDEELDFALLRLSEDVGKKAPGDARQAEARGWIELRSDPVDFEGQGVVAILQHPRAQPLKLSLGMEQSIKVEAGGCRIRYTVPTEPGSSGSPVFDGDWTLVALHHSGDPATVKPQFNEGIPISRITARPKVGALLQEIADDE